MNILKKMSEHFDVKDGELVTIHSEMLEIGYKVNVSAPARVKSKDIAGFLLSNLPWPFVFGMNESVGKDVFVINATPSNQDIKVCFNRVEVKK